MTYVAAKALFLECYPKFAEINHNNLEIIDAWEEFKIQLLSMNSITREEFEKWNIKEM